MAENKDPQIIKENEKSSSLFSKKEKGVLKHNDKKFAVGLTWLTTDMEINSGGLAKERAQKLEADYYCTRSTIAGQHGFGFLGIGHRMNMPAAAAIAADMLVGDWHGIFKADNGWWYLAVRSDNISPDGDRFFFSEEDAYSHLVEQGNQHNWPRFYAPETWNIEEASPSIPLDRLLEDIGAAPVLKATNMNAIFGGRRRRNFIFLIGFMALAFLFSAAILPSFVKKAKEKREATAQPVIMAPAVIKPPPKVVDVTIQSAGFAGALSLPKPSAVVNLCSQGFSRIIEPLPGWELHSASCNMAGNNVAVDSAWKRKVGSLDLIKNYLADFPMNVSVSYNGIDTVQANFRLGDLNRISDSLKVLDRATQISVLYDRFGGIGRMELGDVTPPPPQPSQGIGNPLAAQEEQPRQLPPYLKMSIITRTPPSVIAPYFDVPGLKLQNITWSIGRKAWTYTAEILYSSPVFNAYYGAQPNAQ